MLLSQALAYGKQGWKVLPIHSIHNSRCTCSRRECTNTGKHPKIDNWLENCSSDSEQIVRWWHKWPDANIGLATGTKSGFVVLDVDPRHGGQKSLENLVSQYGQLPNTLVANSGGGGVHLYFRSPDIRVTNRTNILPGLDVRGDGGYIIAPPSQHQSTAHYTWTDSPNYEKLLPIPNWLLNLFTRQKNLYIVNSRSISEGGRNNFLTHEAGKLRKKGLERFELVQVLQQINKERCFPPLSEDEVSRIAYSIARYPSGNIQSVPSISWPDEPDELPPLIAPVPTLDEKLIPPLFRPWITDVAERMQVSPEFVMGPALVALSAVVGRKIGIHPKQHDNWLVVPNLWGAIVARPGYFKSPTIAEAFRPLDRLIEEARKEFNLTKQQASSTQTIAAMQLEAIKELIKRAIKDGNQTEIETLKERLEELERDQQNATPMERRYKTNDATVEKIARLLNDNPNGILLLRDELNGWLQSLNKAGREGDREFYLEAWNGYGSYTVDRIGSGTLHVPALCLSVFGGIQPGKLQDYVEKAVNGKTEDDGLLQRFQILIYPDVSPNWENVDRLPNHEALEEIYQLFHRLDQINIPTEENCIPSVRFSAQAQDIFNSWRAKLEKRLRSGEIECQAFESHLAKYRSLMPSLALLFWILENPENIIESSHVSASATSMAVEWCDFLEKHASKVYRVSEISQNLSAYLLAKRIESGDICDNTPIRSIYRKQWRGLRNSEQVNHALAYLEELNWIKIVKTPVKGGFTNRIILHPKFNKARSSHEQ